MSRFAIRRASLRIASSGSTPSRSSCRTRASSALAGSCAWSTTTPSAPLKLWPERSAEASTCRLPGNWSANSWRTAFTFRRTNDRAISGVVSPKRPRSGAESSRAITKIANVPASAMPTTWRAVTVIRASSRSRSSSAHHPVA